MHEKGLLRSKPDSYTKLNKYFMIFVCKGTDFCAFRQYLKYGILLQDIS